MPRKEGNLEKRLWEGADELRANSELNSQEYSMPVLGLIFLKYADNRFTLATEKLKGEKQSTRKGASIVRDKPLSPRDYQAEGIMYLPEEARFSYLLNLPEGKDRGKAVNEAMKAIEEYNTDLKGVLPQTYNRLENDLLGALLKNFSGIPKDIEGDVFGRIYEYFLSNFAMSEGRGGGEFFTPPSIVKLIVEIIEPFKGTVFDPACGSGGMFIQSENFRKEHSQNSNSGNVISVYGQEKTTTTVKLAKMNLAVHGMSGDIIQGNTFYNDVHESIGRFNYVMANPPFNVKRVDREKIKDDPRFIYGLPTADNANYLWIQIFLSALNKTGRAGFVMANSASDAGHSEKEIRKKLVEDRVVDVMVAVGTNFFYTVTLACTLWFLDKGKADTNRKEKVLFIDARNIYQDIDRSHREFTEEQIKQIAGIVRSYRKEPGAAKYKDVKGLCKVASIKEIEEQDYSLNPGRYVGNGDAKKDVFDFKEKVEGLTDEFKSLTDEAHNLEKNIINNIKKII